MLTAFPYLELSLRCPWTSGSRAHMTFFYFAMQEDVRRLELSHGGSGRRPPENRPWVWTLRVAAWLGDDCDPCRFLLSVSNLSNNDNKQTIKNTRQRLWVSARAWQKQRHPDSISVWKKGRRLYLPEGNISYFDYSGLVKKKSHVKCDKSERVWVVYSFSLNNCARVPLSLFSSVKLVSIFLLFAVSQQ